MAEVKAKLNNLRMAPRKVRAITNLIKNKDVNRALDQLEHFIRRPVSPVRKLLNSAIANAENNFNMVKDNLYIKSVVVEEGAKLRRFRAKGFGRAEPIQKKTSHIIIILDEKKPGMRREKQAVKSKEEENRLAKEAKSRDSKKPEIKREVGSKGNILGNIGKKMFQRKSV
jgi:large subunit ribosomal protein L22